MKRTPIEVKGIQLRHAPWNPRAAISPESVEDLTASIRTDGLIQRLAVVVDPDKSLGLDGYEHYIVIAGNRRFVACVQAGLDSIPVEVMDVDIQTAKRMTLIENLQRRDVDPLMEAELIRGLTEDGMTIEQIAAETGRGEKWVWRRQQLTALSQKWRDVVANSTTPFSSTAWSTLHGTRRRSRTRPWGASRSTPTRESSSGGTSAGCSTN